MTGKWDQRQPVFPEMSDSSHVFSWTVWLWLGLLSSLTKPNVWKLKLRHSFHDCQRFLQSHIQSCLFFYMATRPFTCWHMAENIQMLSRIVHFGVKHAMLSAVFESHLTTDEEDAERLEQRCHPLHEPTSGQVQSSPAQVTEPEALRQTHAFVPWTRILKPILVGENRCKPSVRCLSCQRHPVEPLDAKELLYLCGETPACVLLSAFSSMSLSHPLSHTHLKHMRAQAGTHAGKKSLFQFCWGNMTVIFGLLLALLRGEAGVKPTPRAGQNCSKFFVLKEKKNKKQIRV